MSTGSHHGLPEGTSSCQSSLDVDDEGGSSASSNSNSLVMHVTGSFHVEEKLGIHEHLSEYLSPRRLKATSISTLIIAPEQDYVKLD